LPHYTLKNRETIASLTVEFYCLTSFWILSCVKFGVLNCNNRICLHFGVLLRFKF